jgi:DNA mismatch endonuclease (patch repair protein)
MRANRKADTRPELALRSAMHRLGLRFRVRFAITARGLRVEPDVVFTRARVAAFVDGCYWHSCPDHGVSPSSNAAYWLSKLAGNVARDRRVDTALAGEGWTVIRIWEHDVTSHADSVATAIADIVR